MRAATTARFAWWRAHAAARTPASSARCRRSTNGVSSPGRSRRSSRTSGGRGRASCSSSTTTSAPTRGGCAILCEALTPLRIRWMGQVGVQVAEDESLLHALRKSGCEGVLIGFESLNPANLAAMHKPVNGREPRATARRSAGCAGTVSACTGHSYSGTTPTRRRVSRSRWSLPFASSSSSPRSTTSCRFPERRCMLACAPKGACCASGGGWIPGTGTARWRFARRASQPRRCQRRATTAARRFYRWSSVMRRAEFQANLSTPFRAVTFFAQNVVARRDVERRFGLLVGE